MVELSMQIALYNEIYSPKHMSRLRWTFLSFIKQSLAGCSQRLKSNPMVPPVIAVAASTLRAGFPALPDPFFCLNGSGKMGFFGRAKGWGIRSEVCRRIVAFVCEVLTCPVSGRCIFDRDARVMMVFRNRWQRS